LEKLLVTGLDQNGTADVNDTGTLSLVQTNVVTSALANAVEWRDLISLYDSLDAAYLPNAAWFMSSKVRNTLLKTLSDLGLLFFAPALTLGAFDLLLGRPIVITQSLVQNLTTTSSIPILFGDLSSALAVVDTPLISHLSTERYAERNLVLLNLFVRCGSTGMVPAALQGLKLAGHKRQIDSVTYIRAGLGLALFLLPLKGKNEKALNISRRRYGRFIVALCRESSEPHWQPADHTDHRIASAHRFHGRRFRRGLPWRHSGSGDCGNCW
jgi:hypothetical protein